MPSRHRTGFSLVLCSHRSQDESRNTPVFLALSPLLVEISYSKAGHMLEWDELISFCHSTVGKNPSVAAVTLERYWVIFN